MASNKSQDNVTSAASRIGPSGIAWPKEIVAVLMSPRILHKSGDRPPAAHRSRTQPSSSAPGAVEAGRAGGVAVQRDHCGVRDAGAWWRWRWSG